MPVTTSSLTKRPEIKTELPGPNGRKIVEVDAKFLNPAYPRPLFKLVAERASGVWVEDVDGNLFLDCNAGVAVCSTGHCHPEVVKAIQQQAEELIHICGSNYYYRHMPQLAEKLDAIVPIRWPTRTHFANSGAEAVETALKLAMHATGREKFVGFFNSFHGRTLGSLSLTSSKAVQRKGFKRQALDVVHVPYPNEFRNPFSAADCGDGGASQGALNWIEERLFKTTTPPEEVAAIVVEAVQGEGGYVPAPKDFLKGLRRICDEHGILLIVDEVQSGMGRTGKMFACEHYDVQPDIVCIAKGIGSGLPLGACVARADLMDWKSGAHSSTFGGNPVCIAAALKTIELLEGGLVNNAAEVGAFLKAGLEKLQRKYDCIGDVRGMGLMIGVEFVTDKVSMEPNAELRDRIEMACFERGLIILGAGMNTIRWSPPLILTRDNAAVALEIFDEAISASIPDSRSLSTIDRKKIEDEALRKTDTKRESFHSQPKLKPVTLEPEPTAFDYEKLNELTGKEAPGLRHIVEEEAVARQYVTTRYQTLIDRKYVHGLLPGENEELDALKAALDKMDEPFYDGIIKRLRRLVEKRGV